LFIVTLRSGGTSDTARSLYSLAADSSNSNFSAASLFAS
jgi:hypothetical protein